MLFHFLESYIFGEVGERSPTPSVCVSLHSSESESLVVLLLTAVDWLPTGVAKCFLISFLDST